MGLEQEQIGNIIKDARKRKKLSQTNLGKLIGLGVQVISDYEKGKIKVIPFSNRVQISEILNIPLNVLLYDDECGGQNSERFIYEIPIVAEKDIIKENLKTNIINTLITNAIKLIFQSVCKEEIEIETAESVCVNEFVRRGLSETDALALAKFFTWICMEQPNVLSRWNDKMLRDKMDAGKK